MKVQPYNKNHRTALVIDTRNGFDNPFAERVNRLLQSVNGDNIKVDVFHIVGSAITAGTPAVSSFGFKPATPSYGGEATIVPGAPGSWKAETTGETGVAEAVRAALPEYDMVVVSTP